MVVYMFHLNNLGELDKIPGIKTLIECNDGQMYTLKNPALITRELSESLLHQGKLRYKITSNKLLNPKNLPDEFEKNSLAKFNLGDDENTTFEYIDGRYFFRYMSPLRTTQACLTCHHNQGYKVGDIRGGISVSIDAEEVNERILFSRLVMIISGIAIILLIVACIKYVSSHFIQDLQNAQKKLENLALYDSLTSLLNRSSGMQVLSSELARSQRSQSPLCLALLDLDFFKKINDTYGHLHGDEVLKTFADQMKNSTREYDACCRYGGEEFLLIMPDTTIDNAQIVLTRLLERVRDSEVVTDKHRIKYSFSGGLVVYKGDLTLEAFIERADKLLYKAKTEGRDRVKSSQ